MNQPTEYVNPRLEELNANINEISTKLNKLGYSGGRNIEERYFVYFFLPLFCGESTENASELMNIWHNVAGTLMNSVDVIDESGRVVAVVPPIHDNKVIELNSNNRDNLVYNLQTAEKISALSPGLGQSIAAKTLDEKAASLLGNGEAVNLIDMWNKLFAYYEKPLIAKTGSIKKNDTPEYTYDYE